MAKIGQRGGLRRQLRMIRTIGFKCVADRLDRIHQGRRREKLFHR